MTGGSEGGSQRIPDHFLEYDDNLVYYHDGEPFTGVGYTEDAGHGLSEIEYENGLQEGWQRDWYPSGILRAEAHFHRNVVDGYRREFRPDGSVALEEFYECGVRVSASTFDTSGRKVSAFEIQPDDPQYALLEQLRRGRAGGDECPDSDSD